MRLALSAKFDDTSFNSEHTTFVTLCYLAATRLQ